MCVVRVFICLIICLPITPWIFGSCDDQYYHIISSLYFSNDLDACSFKIEIVSFTSCSRIMSPTSIFTCACSNSQFSHLGSVSIISRASNCTSFFSRISEKSSSSNSPWQINSLRGSVPARLIAHRNKSCLTISKISFRLKSSVGLRRRLYLLQGNGSPSLPNGLNQSNESLIQSKSTLLWMCSHSASKFYGKSFLSSSTVIPLSAASFSLAYFASSSFFALRSFSRVRQSWSGSTMG